jgi:hypothetical protein
MPFEASELPRAKELRGQEVAALPAGTEGEQVQEYQETNRQKDEDELIHWLPSVATARRWWRLFIPPRLEALLARLLRR